MNARDKRNTSEQLEQFQAERLTADELYLVSGGLLAKTTLSGTTGSTFSICHTDGVDDGDGSR